MSEVKVNIEADKADEEVVSYTLRGIPVKTVHEAIISFAREISYKRDKNYNIEQAYVEALKDWVESRKSPVNA